MIYQLNFNPKTILTNLNEVILKLALGILTFIIGFILGKLVERIVFKLLNELEVNRLLKDATGLKVNLDHLISSILAYSIYFLSFVAALEQIGLANIILYLISAAVIIIILVSFFLSIRDFIPNLIAGLYLYRKERLKPGKYVEIDDIKGKLLSIDLIQLKIEAKNGDVINIPNSTVIKSKLKIRKRKL